MTDEAKPKRRRRKAEYVLFGIPEPEGGYEVVVNGCDSQQAAIKAGKVAGLKGRYTVAAMHRTVEFKATIIERYAVEDVD